MPPLDPYDVAGVPPGCKLPSRFSVHELMTLVEVCSVTGEDMAGLSFAQAERYLKLHHNMVHTDRKTPVPYVARLRLLRREIAMMSRFEFRRFADHPEAIREVVQLIQGDPKAEDLQTNQGLVGTLQRIADEVAHPIAKGV